MHHRAALLAFVLAVFLSSPALVAAQGGEASELETEARARFSLGQLYYSQARFAEAAIEFEAAYATHPHPLLLHNIYLARRDLGDIPAAVDALTRYLAAATDLDASDRRLLEGRLAAMERQLAATRPTPTPVVVEDPVVGTADPVDVGEELGDPADSPLPPAASARRGPDDGLMTGAIVSFSVAGAAALMIAITGPLAMVERSNLESSCAPFCSDAQVAPAASLGLASDVGIGVALAAGVTGGILAIVANVGGSETVAVAPSVSSEHAVVVVGGTF